MYKFLQATRVGVIYSFRYNAIMTIFVDNFMLILPYYLSNHGLINYVDTKAQCHLKQLT